MSAITLTFLGNAGNRKLYGIGFTNTELNSSFGTNKEPKTLEVSRIEARKNVRLIETTYKNSDNSINSIIEHSTGLVKF